MKMAGFKVVTHKGKNISIVDLSNTKVPQQIEILKDAQKTISAMAPKSALILTDESNAEVNKEAMAVVLNFAKNNTPYVRASAAVGAEKLKSVILTNISTSVGREIKNFDNRTLAMDWLVNQP